MNFEISIDKSLQSNNEKETTSYSIIFSLGLQSLISTLILKGRWEIMKCFQSVLAVACDFKWCFSINIRVLCRVNHNDISKNMLNTTSCWLVIFLLLLFPFKIFMNS